MPTDATFESFEKELNRLVESFGKRLVELKQPGYAEAQLRDDFLNPFFDALGWDRINTAGLIQKEREVEIESATQIGGGRKRADYLFRTDKRDRFVCEAKKPAEELSARYAFQAKRYAWNKGVPVAVLTDFEELKIYIVGGKPHIDEPHVGEWKNWHYRQYPLIARELWDLLARDKIAAGSIDAALDALPKKATGTGKARQQWLIKPDRTRALDTNFLEFLDETRRDLASDIYKNNDHAELLEDNKLTEACQRVIDRILFLRICEDRDIDTGQRLQTIVEKWRKNTGDEDTGRRAHQQPMELHDAPPANYGNDGIRVPKESLWRAVVRHFRALDRRPPTHVPFFNGNLFKPHFTETLVIGDEWLAGFIGDLSDDESPYLFNVIDVEILGSVYERFLGNVVRPHGKGITVEPKPEVRKAGGVYYTPRYIVNYIVEQTAGKLLDEIAGSTAAPAVASDAPSDASGAREPSAAPGVPRGAEHSARGGRAPLKDFEKKTAALHLLDPACGSGSFLIRAFERVCEHWQKRLTADLREVLECASPLALSTATAGKKRQGTAAVQDAGATAERKAARAAWQKKHRALCWLDESTGDVHLTVALKRQILTQNIYGVDLDAAAVEVTQLSLYLKMLEHENRTTLQRQRELLADETEIALLPPLQDNIKCGNSLIASDFSMMPEDLVRVHAFDWPVQFQSIMKAGGFDAVIGNPPYGAVLSEDETQYLRIQFQSAEYQIDTYPIFAERSHGLLKQGAYFGVIIPSAWVASEYNIKFRQFLCASLQPINIVIAPKDVFEDATVETVVMTCRKGVENAGEIEIGRWDVSPRKNYLLPFSRITNDSSNIFPIYREPQVDKLIAKVAGANGRFGEVSEAVWGIKVYQKGKGKPSQKGPESDSRCFHAESKKKSTHWKLVGGSEIRRFDFDWKGGWVDYGIWLAEPRTPDWFQGERILIREVTANGCIQASITNEPFVFSNSVDGLRLKPNAKVALKFLLALLNSRLLSFYNLHTSANAFKGAFPKVLIKDLLAFPLPPIENNKARHDKLVVLVDKLLGLMPKLRAATADSEKAVLQNAVTATNQQIDALVYELYGLTEDEIKLVEGNA